jgi:hypothetical protein
VIEHYTVENTPGYTQAELDALNDELAHALSGAAWEGTLSEADTAAIIQEHNALVAQRRPRS